MPVVALVHGAQSTLGYFPDHLLPVAGDVIRIGEGGTIEPGRYEVGRREMERPENRDASWVGVYLRPVDPVTPAAGTALDWLKHLVGNLPYDERTGTPIIGRDRVKDWFDLGVLAEAREFLIAQGVRVDDDE